MVKVITAANAKDPGPPPADILKRGYRGLPHHKAAKKGQGVEPETEPTAEGEGEGNGGEDIGEEEDTP